MTKATRLQADEQASSFVLEFQHDRRVVLLNFEDEKIDVKIYFVDTDDMQCLYNCQSAGYVVYLNQKMVLV
ncbi:hypothetical protein CPI31_08925 [Moraxella catarrhalis]|uniref:hypothetical protein n=1 Tax=Moraxella catarrhalis TaxID=480 RepID=UPI00128E4453|nr:hypothetical protein [Moraxella catarrhalis]MPX19662.1 hypothetical protein [Moraxella catarrhalis]